MDTPAIPAPEQTLTISNTGYGTSEPLKVEWSVGSGPGTFEKLGDSCSDVRLVDGHDCTVTFRYTNDTGAGTKTAQVSVSANLAGTAASAQLVGHGSPGALVWDPATHSFADDESHAFTLTNQLAPTVTIGIDLVQPEGPPNDGFSITSEDCEGAVLAAGEHCSVTVEYDEKGVVDPTSELDAWSDAAPTDIYFAQLLVT